MQSKMIWDPYVRFFHWTLVTAFAANALFLDPESWIHEWVGYTVVGLVGARILWGFIGTQYARFSSFPPSVSGSTEQLTDIATGRITHHNGHTPLGALMIYNILATLLVIGLSGYLMTTNMFWGVEWPEELHEIAVTWAEISIVIHIAAVTFESWRTGINLPRSMVTGYKTLKSN
jgi:cytochrome b